MLAPEEPQELISGDFEPRVAIDPPAEQSVLLRFGVNVVGYLRNESGLGSAVRGYVSALRCSGAPVSLKDLSDLSVNRSEDQTLGRFDSEHPYDINLFCINADQHFVIMSSLGESFFRGRYNIGIWAWELPTFPAKWHDRFAYYDEIWVGTSFIANTLAPVSPIPVVRIPPVMTVSQVGSAQRGRSALGIASDEFVFLFVFDFHSYFERKNPLATIEAFRRAFAPYERARLLVKCVNPESDPASFAKMREQAAGGQVTILSGYWSALEMADLMASCDVYVSLHRSEGTGLTISEAMAIGKPVIATAWSGNMDFMNVANSYPVRYDLIELETSVGPYQKGETWADPSVEHAASLMCHAFEHRTEASKIGEAAAKAIEQNFSETAIARLIEPRLAVIADRHQFGTLRQGLSTGQITPKHVAYRSLVDRIRSVARATVPQDAIVAVISRGDPDLLSLGDGRRGWHFPQTGDGTYAGFNPADSATAIAHLEVLRAKGSGYLLVPATASWWLDYYKEFRQHLETCYRPIVDDETCTLFDLTVTQRDHLQGGRIDSIYLQFDSIAGQLEQLKRDSGQAEKLRALIDQNAQAAETNRAELDRRLGQIESMLAELKRQAEVKERAMSRAIATSRTASPSTPQGSSATS